MTSYRCIILHWNLTTCYHSTGFPHKTQSTALSQIQLQYLLSPLLLSLFLAVLWLFQLWAPSTTAAYLTPTILTWPLWTCPWHMWILTWPHRSCLIPVDLDLTSWILTWNRFSPYLLTQSGPSPTCLAQQVTSYNSSCFCIHAWSVASIGSLWPWKGFLTNLPL